MVAESTVNSTKKSTNKQSIIIYLSEIRAILDTCRCVILLVPLDDLEVKDEPDGGQGGKETESRRQVPDNSDQVDGCGGRPHESVHQST